MTLLRGAQPDAFRLVVTSIRLENLARQASARPSDGRRRGAAAELARQKKEAEDSLAAQEKAKTENKAQFRP